MKTQISKSILFHFFSGQSTPLEKEQVKEWLADADNQERYYEWLEEWETARPQYHPNVSDALDKFRLAMDSEISSAITPASQRPYSTSFRWIKIAASLALLVCSSLFIFRDNILYTTYASDYGELRYINLPDGSAIVLNSNSSLRLPRFSFGSDNRDVYLEGEAQFSVKHTVDDKKFIVHTPDHLEVEVVGTEFIVYSRKRGSKVVLTKGKVILRSTIDTLKRSMAVKPGDVVTIHGGVFNVKEQQAVQQHSAWKEHRFVFDKTSLKEIAAEMEETFGVQLTIQDSTLSERELTGTYEAATADELIDVLSRALDINVERDGKKINVHSGNN